MVDVAGNTTLDGVNGFTILGSNFTWNGGYLPFVRVSWGDTPPTAQVNPSLPGTNWCVLTMEFFGLA